MSNQSHKKEQQQSEVGQPGKRINGLMQQRTRRRGQKQHNGHLVDTSITEITKSNDNNQQKLNLRVGTRQNNQEKLKRTRKTSQTEIPKISKPINNSLSCDDIPLSMSASPEPPYRSAQRNKNIVLMYDEDDKTSKEVSQPANLGIALPILAKYELTIDTLQKHEVERHKDTEAEQTSSDDKKSVAITPRLLQDHDDNQNEVQNKGLHVIQWLSDLESNEDK
ncbi:uncharacterized protein [Amphiura filiformis]|uniref:uncharacterized protein n=1 Tax=Amphiura filiformis TaxID=82378 RepID=UPI003B211368